LYEAADGADEDLRLRGKHLAALAGDAIHEVDREEVELPERPAHGPRDRGHDRAREERLPEQPPTHAHQTGRRASGDRSSRGPRGTGAGRRRRQLWLRRHRFDHPGAPPPRLGRQRVIGDDLGTGPRIAQDGHNGGLGSRPHGHARAARPGLALPGLGAGGRPALLPERPRPGGGGRLGTARRVRRSGPRGAIVATLERLGADETLLVQSGRPVLVVPSHSDAPRVLISTAMVVPAWSTDGEFRRLEEAGLTMFGQMTAASWFYIGTQGILGFTHETFAAVARRHFDGSLQGRRVLTAGLGGMGGA